MTPRASDRPAWLCLVLLTFVPVRALAQTIAVPDVEALYAAVNDPANAGATLVLAPGTYVLSANDPSGLPRPNGGRLEMQHDMSVLGLDGDRSAVVIDAFALPASSFPASTNGVPTGPNAPIRLGRGRNALEWLTVRDGRFAQANIDTGLQPLDPWNTFVRIAHVASSGSTRGLNVLNFGPQASGQTIDAEIVDCYFFDNVFNLSEGVRLGNFQGAVGSTVNARMSGNVSWGQKQGRLIVNNRAQSSTVKVISSGNWFHDNGGGTIVIGGLSSNNTRADGNTIVLESRGDRFIGNTADTEFDHGGLIVLGSENISALGGGSYNHVTVRLWGVRTSENADADVTAIGARWFSASADGLSVNNLVTIEIQGAGQGHAAGQPVELFADTAPAGVTYGNQVTVIRQRPLVLLKADDAGITNVPIPGRGARRPVPADFAAARPTTREK